MIFWHHLTCILLGPLFKRGMNGHVCLHGHLTDNWSDDFRLVHGAMYQFRFGASIFLFTCTFNWYLNRSGNWTDNCTDRVKGPLILHTCITVLNITLWNLGLLGKIAFLVFLSYAQKFWLWWSGGHVTVRLTTEISDSVFRQHWWKSNVKNKNGRCCSVVKKKNYFACSKKHLQRSKGKKTWCGR